MFSALASPTYLCWCRQLSNCDANLSYVSQDNDFAGGADIPSSAPSAADSVELHSGADADASGDGLDSNGDPDGEYETDTSSDESDSESGPDAQMDDDRSAAEREYLR